MTQMLSEDASARQSNVPKSVLPSVRIASSSFTAAQSRPDCVALCRCHSRRNNARHVVRLCRYDSDPSRPPSFELSVPPLYSQEVLLID